MRDQAELAKIGGVTRERVTQIMNLLLLAPDLQEKLFFLAHTTNARYKLRERSLRQVLAAINWRQQHDELRSLLPGQN